MDSFIKLGRAHESETEDRIVAARLKGNGRNLQWISSESVCLDMGREESANRTENRALPVHIRDAN
jgi:hypothetical protein